MNKLEKVVRKHFKKSGIKAELFYTCLDNNKYYCYSFTDNVGKFFSFTSKEQIKATIKILSFLIHLKEHNVVKH